MPIDVDIRVREVLGPILQEAERSAKQTILRVIIEKLFGALPGWAGEKVASRPAS